MRFLPPDFIATLEATINEEVAEKGRQLRIGGASDWADYQLRVGEIKGLSRIIDIISELTEDKT